MTEIQIDKRIYNVGDTITTIWTKCADGGCRVETLPNSDIIRVAEAIAKQRDTQ